MLHLQLPPHLEDISSTRIRENVDLNRDISTLVAPVIQDFIYQNGLYLRDTPDKPLLYAGDLEFQWEEAPTRPLVVADAHRRACRERESPAGRPSSAADDRVLLLRRTGAGRPMLGFAQLSPAAHLSALRCPGGQRPGQPGAPAGGEATCSSSPPWRQTPPSKHRDYAQLLLSELLARALEKEYVYAVFAPPRRAAAPRSLEDTLARVRASFRREGEAPIREADMRAPSGAAPESGDHHSGAPVPQQPRVLTAIRRSHERLQTAPSPPCTPAPWC